jgi:predicted amidohydrolase
MKIAFYQCEGVAGSKEENLKILRRAALSAAEQEGAIVDLLGDVCHRL